jgi:hypothetical protein
MRTNLKVPFSEKDLVKKLGGKWDSVKRTWYVENVDNLELFMPWLPAHSYYHAKTVQHDKKRKTKLKRHSAEYHGRPRLVVGSEFVDVKCDCGVPNWEVCKHSFHEYMVDDNLTEQTSHLRSILREA